MIKVGLSNGWGGSSACTASSELNAKRSPPCVCNRQSTDPFLEQLRRQILGGELHCHLVLARPAMTIRLFTIHSSWPKFDPVSFGTTQVILIKLCDQRQINGPIRDTVNPYANAIERACRLWLDSRGIL